MTTHIIFSSGLVLYLGYKFFMLDLPTSILIALSVAVMQYIIDAVSHEKLIVRRRGKTIEIIRRTWVLHSPVGVTLLSLPFTLLDLYILGTSETLYQVLALTLVGGYTHLLLDMMTEKGIYLWKRRLWNKRLISNDNFLANILFILVGLLLMLEIIL